MLEEMAWMANDFARERKWKRMLARKAGRAVQKHFSKKQSEAQRQIKEVQKNAAKLAKKIKSWWQKIEKIVLHKIQEKVEQQKKQVQERHLDFLANKLKDCLQ